MPCHPQSALAGLNARPRVAAFGVSTSRAALTARSRAMRAREPGQIRKEAALSGSGHVPRICLARASHDANARGPLSKAGRTVLRCSVLSRGPLARASPAASAAGEAPRSRRSRSVSGRTARCRPFSASRRSKAEAVAAAPRAAPGTCACRRRGPGPPARSRSASRRGGGGVRVRGRHRRSTPPSARAGSDGPAAAPPCGRGLAMSLQVPPLALLGTMSAARPIGCSPLRAWAGSVEYPSVMKMSKRRFIQRTSASSRRSIFSPGKPGMSTKRPPPTVLQRWSSITLLRILAAAGEATAPAIRTTSGSAIKARADGCV